jgi:hypothetical protein
MPIMDYGLPAPELSQGNGRFWGAIDKLAQTWPAKMAQSAYDAVRLPGQVAGGIMSAQPAQPGIMWSDMDEARQQATQGTMMNRATDLAGLVMGGGGLAGRSVSAPGEMTLGVVPVDIAKALNVKKNLPQDEGFAAAVRNTKGASVEDGSLVLPVTRNQRPEQSLDEAVRGGVFYLPQGSKDAKYYTGKNHNFAYGGTEKIEGTTAVSNPLYVKGATGGKAPEAAFDQMLGKGAYQNMRKDALHYGTGQPHNIKVEAAEKFLQQYAPEMVDLAEHIVRNSTKGNQLPYALQEAAVASAARKAGHDSVVGYSVSRKTKEPFISELFDVRENVYPNAAGDYGMWPQFKPR